MAQLSNFEGRRVVDIQYPPAQPLDPSDLEMAQPLRKGQPLHAQDVARSIDGLFATGQFEDIIVEGEPSGDGVIVRFVMEGTPFVVGTTVAGKIAKPPSEGQVVSATQLNLGAPFHEEDLTHAVDLVKHLLESNGFYEAQVTPVIDHGKGAQQVFITLKIDEHKRAKYSMPTVQGDAELNDNTFVRATAGGYPSFTGGVRLRLHEQREVSSVF